MLKLEKCGDSETLVNQGFEIDSVEDGSKDGVILDVKH